MGFDCALVGSNDYEATAGSDVVVITAGVPRRKDPETGKYTSRDELVEINRKIVGGVAREVAKRSPDAILICVANPLDAMCHVLLKESGFPKERVIGMAGVLDTARYKTFIAEALKVKADDAMTLANRAECYLRVRQFHLALVDADAALAADPSHHKALYKRAMALNGLGRYPDAIKTLKQLLDKEPEDPAALNALAECELLQSQAFAGDYHMPSLLFGRSATSFRRCADYVGPVKIVGDRPFGRGVVTTRAMRAASTSPAHSTPRSPLRVYVRVRVCVFPPPVPWIGRPRIVQVSSGFAPSPPARRRPRERSTAACVDPEGVQQAPSIRIISICSQHSNRPRMHWIQN